jgi:Zn-dependent protease
MNTAVRLGHFAGVEVVADVSVFVVAALLAWANHLSLDTTYELGSVGTLLAVVVVVAYVLSLLVHEALHALVAIRRGLDARRIRLLVFGGYSTIEGRDVTPGDEFLVAIAGPAGSLALAGLFSLLALGMGWQEPTAETFALLAIVNLLIAGFNLLPGLPLDGGRAFRAVLWNINGDRLRSTRMATLAGRGLGLAVVGVGIVVVVIRRDLAGFVWMLLGWFLFRSATAAGKREEVLAFVDGLTVREVMHPTPEAVPGVLRVADVEALFQSGPTLRTLPVEVDGRVTGMIGQAEIDGLSPGRRELGRAASVMSPIGPSDLIDADTPIDALLVRAGTEPRLLVVDEGLVVGVVEAADLDHAFSSLSGTP